MEQLEKASIYNYKKITKEDLDKFLEDHFKQIEFPQFSKISDGLYQYRYKNTSYISTLEFFEQVDEKVKENIKKYGEIARSKSTNSSTR